MAILDVVEWLDNSGREIVHREPPGGSGEFRMGSQLVVRESQAAVFFRDGKGLDSFGPGRHTLSTANIPLLTKLLSLPFGGKSPFRAEVLFVSLQTFTDLKWGTKEPIPFRDTELGMVRLRAFGSYTMRITEPVLLVNNVVGTRGIFSTEAIGSFLRDAIVSRFNDVLGENMKSVLDLAQIYDELGVALKVRVQTDFAKFGIEVQDFFVQAITPPEAVQKAMDERAAMGAAGDLNRYMKFKAANSMQAAAENPSGGAGTGMGMGAGLGLGMMMPGMINQAMQGGGQPAQGGGGGAAPQAATVACPSCQTANAAGAKFCSNCGTQIPGAAACPSCKATLAPGSKFCSECGTNVSAKAACPGCKAENEPSAKFCASCGTKMG